MITVSELFCMYVLQLKSAMYKREFSAPKFHEESLFISVHAQHSYPQLRYSGYRNFFHRKKKRSMQLLDLLEIATLHESEAISI